MNPSPWSEQERRFASQSTSQQLGALHALFLEQSAHYIGFPNSRILSFEELGAFLKFNINNIGDPYHPNDGINTCLLEQEVIAFWAEQLHLDPEFAWGYITSGSTEAIMYGIAQGQLIQRSGFAVLGGVSLLFAQDCTLVAVASPGDSKLKDGSLNLEALSDLIVSLNGRPFILNLTVGTTFHGAIGPACRVTILERHQCRDVHVHVDAALYGPMLPWIDGSEVFDFRLPIHTLSFSGHKFLGSPMPCGVLISHAMHHSL